MTSHVATNSDTSSLSKKRLEWIAAVLFGVSVILAGWGNWQETLRALWPFGPSGIAAALALAAVLLFVWARSDSASLLPAVHWTLVALIYGAASWLLLGDTVLAEAPRALAIAFGGLSVLLLLVVASMFSEGSLSDTFNLQTSAASTVLMLWTAVVVYAVAFITGLALLNDGGGINCATPLAPTVRDCIVESAWPDYLILLGIPGAAAAISKAKSQGKTELSDSGEASNKITEVQYFVFNIIAMLFVVGGLWRFGRLGDVPDVLLGLTGASAFTYALVKRFPAATTGPDR